MNIVMLLLFCIAHLTTLAIVSAFPLPKNTRTTPPNCKCPNLPLLMKPVCGSNGRNYSDWCQFTNAKFNDPGLGRVLCQALRDMSESRLSTPSQPRQVTKCLTNGQTVSGTRYQLNFQLQSQPGIGFRCDSACPCPALVCPHTVVRLSELP